jgi:type I restriction enzyme S subunit
MEMIPRQACAQVILPVPTKAEQTAIATALKDADAYIQSLEKLIEKKRNIKQGAMQELLKPKEGWVEISIHQIADNKKELFDDGDWIESEHITSEGIRLIQTGNIGIGTFIEKDSKKYINEASFKSIKCKELKIGDLLICRLAEPAGRSCILPDIGEYKIVTSVDVTIFRPRAEMANRIFLVNVFSTNAWLETISGMSGGTTHKRISRGALGRMKINLPSLSEQNRIGEILNEMQKEIIQIELKLSKAKQLKQGMMQELLTGKIRLV